MAVKRLMQADLIKALDVLTETVDSNEVRIKHLNELICDNLPYDTKKVFLDGIVKYENLSVLASKVSDVFLMLLDIYTYGTYAMLSKDEWDWRAFARHLYTMLYEHSKTINRQLNDIVKVLKADIDKNYDLSSLVQAKRKFSALIAENSKFAKQIRVNVDAHFDGDFTKRLSLIKNLSYSSVTALYFDYNCKMHDFLSTLKPALERLRLSADASYHTLIAFSIHNSKME